MKRLSAWSLVLLILLLAMVSTAAADAIRQGETGVLLANGTELEGVWSNRNDEFLTLKADGEAILYVSKTLYVCSWTWDAEEIRLNHNGWILTIVPQGSTLRTDVHGKTLMLTRAGDFSGNAGVWYPTAKGGSYTLQLRASGEYRLKQGTNAAVTGTWLDAGGYVILMKKDGTYDVCIREGNQLKLKVGLATYTLRQEAQPTSTPPSYAAPSPTPTPQPVVDARLVGFWRPSGSDWSLLLNEDGTAVLGDGKQVDTGFWRLSGNRCTISMSSQTCEGTYNSVFIRMTVDGKTLSFSKKGEAMDVTGSWAADGYALVISADGSFVGSWGGGAYSGSWQFDGQNVYLSGSNGLTVFKVASGKLQIKVNGKNVLLRKADSENSAVVSVPAVSAGTAGTPAPAADGRALLGKWVDREGLAAAWTLTVYENGTAVLEHYGDARSCEWRIAGDVLTLVSSGKTVATGFVSNAGVIDMTSVDGISFSLRKSVAGTWKVANQNITLILNQDGTAVLSPSASQPIDYLWKLGSNNVLTLDYDGSESSGYYNINSDTIELTVNGRIRTFTRVENTTSGSTSSGGIVGYWTEMSMSGITLDIRQGGRAVLVIDGDSYNCKWQLSGSNLTLSDNGSPIRGTYNSRTGVIQLTVETYTFTFRKGGTSGASTGSSTRSVVGTWTQHVVGGTVTLIVREGGSATLKIATTQYACTWKLSGSTFTLINNGSPVNGTYNSQTDTISITIGTARLNLTRTGN